MTGSDVWYGMDLAINKAQIETIQENFSENEEDDEIIDGTGKYLIPGLFDMHVHLESESHFPLFLMNGITGIREMGNPREDIFELKRKINTGELFGPRMYVCGPILEGDPPFWEDFKVVTTHDEAVQTVRELTNKGADFIKVYHTLDESTYKTIIDEAKRQNLPVTGHIPSELNIISAIHAGQYGIEHMYDIEGYTGSISTRDARDDEEPGYEVFTDFTFDQKKLTELLDTMSKKIFMCPTFVVHEQMAALADYETLKNSPEAQYLPPYYKDVDWNPSHPQSSTNINGLPPLFFKNLGVIHEASKALVKQLAAHSTLLAGTDSPNPFVVPGFSLLQELELLVENGLSAYQALETATCNGAQFLNVSKELGTIEPGKIANLVLLDKNPLEDITALRQNQGTVLNGEFHSREYLERQTESIY